ncbi:MAG: NYN domain-containing protein [Firmicutes bacterium]|nr:NYN domain-containing protein [Bacillota bacterium]
METTNRTIALLIDADNISKEYLGILVEELNNFGDITYKRIYGDFTRTELQKWKQTLLDFAIEPIQQYSYTTGKNATDSAMIIDAMDILYSGKVNCACLATSDSDFTKLATRFRNENFFVIGAGETKTPKSFRAACHRFLLMDVLMREAGAGKAGTSDVEKDSKPTKPAKATATSNSKLIPKTTPNAKQEPKTKNEMPLAVAPIIESESQDSPTNGQEKEIDHKLKIIKLAQQILWDEGDLNGYMHFSTFMNSLYKRDNSFNPKNYGHSNPKSFFMGLKNHDKPVFVIERKENYDLIRMNG